MNQNLLIVDDERRILLALEEMFRYDFNMDIEVYTANSSVEALRILNAIRFDVVLTDIKMPGMDGIALFEKIKENWPRCKTVFLTGYRDFDDMYRIINNRDVKYILKTEDDEVIMEAVREFLLQGQKEMAQQLERTKQEFQAEKGKQWLRKEYIETILADVYRKEDVCEKLKELGINLKAEASALIFLLRVECQWGECKTGKRYYYVELLEKIIRQNMPDKLNCYIHILDETSEIIFIQQHEMEADNWHQVQVVASGALESIQEAFASACEITFSAVISAQPYRFNEFGKALKNLRNIMNGYLGGVRNFIFNCDSFPTFEPEEKIMNIGNMLPALTSYLELHKKQEFFELLEKCLDRITSRSSRHDPEALEAYYNISTLLLRFINENHLEKQLAFKVGLYKLTNVDAHESWQEAAGYLKDVSGAIFSVLGENEDVLDKRALKRVVQYIEENISGDLSLVNLADIGGFNASYFSRLFKKVMNETVSEYVLRKRMELAKKLLSDGDVKILDVARRTGYLSPQSFTRIFRKEVGISPTEYREST